MGQRIEQAMEKSYKITFEITNRWGIVRGQEAFLILISHHTFNLEFENPTHNCGVFMFSLWS